MNAYRDRDDGFGRVRFQERLQKVRRQEPHRRHGKPITCQAARRRLTVREDVPVMQPHEAGLLPAGEGARPEALSLRQEDDLAARPSRGRAEAARDPVEADLRPLRLPALRVGPGAGRPGRTRWDGKGGMAFRFRLDGLSGAAA